MLAILKVLVYTYVVLERDDNMFKLFKRFTGKEKILFIVCCLLVVFQVGVELKMPDYMSEITKLIETEGSTMSDILLNGGYMLLCALLSVVSMIIVGYLSSLLSASFSKNIRKSIFANVTKFSMEEINKFKTSSLITRTTNDITQIEMIISLGLQMAVKAPVMAVWAIAKIINKSLAWSMLTLGCVVILLSVVIALMLAVVPKFKIVQKLVDKVNGVTRENLTGIRVIRAFNAEKFETKRFENVNSELTDTTLFIDRKFAILDPAINMAMQGLVLGVYIIGAILIENAGMSDKLTLFSNMIVFQSYGIQVIMSFLFLTMIFMMYPRSQVSAMRINEILDEVPNIKDGSHFGDTLEFGTIEFKNVSFKYPDADECILENISFSVKEGETVAFIGSTGSGKSTLINLIPRFYDVTEGEILIDGVNIKEYPLEELYNKLGYVPQKAVMFTGTVKDNVIYGTKNGKKASNLDMKKALQVAQADFVEKMEKKEKSHIARGGTNVSGGQKQRLAIARAIARKPEIYIFDDSFSALDYKTDSILRKELKKYTGKATNLIVAQRIGTIMHADKIIVLEAGKCVGMGTHKELMKNCEVYKEIALSQLSKEELENA